MSLYIFFQIIIASIAATSVMTLFSYVVSESFKKLYKEPVLLGAVLKRLDIKFSSRMQTALGWILHYGIGFIFVLGYHLLWHYKILETSWLVSLLLGAISGIIGIISWAILFKITDHQPRIDFKGYYQQLFVAHIIFGSTAFAVYQLF